MSEPDSLIGTSREINQGGAPPAVNMYGSVVFGDTSRSESLVKLEIINSRKKGFLLKDKLSATIRPRVIGGYC